MRGVKGILLLLLALFSGLTLAVSGQAVNFDAKQNELCWRMIEQKATGHCKLHFSMAKGQTVTGFADRNTISNAFSSYNGARNNYPTSFQKLEFALQFFYYSLERYAVRDSLNYIRSADGTIQLSMSIRTSATGGYSFILADNEAQIRQIVVNLQNTHAVKATNYYRTIEKLFAD